VCIAAQHRAGLERLLRYCAREILEHIGVETEPPRIAPARGPSLWDGCDMPMGDGVKFEPDGDEAAQAAPDFEVNQRVSKCG
jgi:hypothetical protein